MTGTTSLGEDFARAAAAKDRDAFDRLLADDGDFKGLTSGRMWEASGPTEVAAVFFDRWFGPSDTIEALIEVATGDDVADTRHVSHRLDLSDAAGPQVAGQQPYFRTTDDRISHLRVLCSGFRPRS